MRVTVRLFARLRDLAGSGELMRDVEAPATLERRLNGILPADVRVRRVREAPPGFDARFSAPVVVPDDGAGAALEVSGTIADVTPDGRVVLDLVATSAGVPVLKGARAVVRTTPTPAV